MTQVSSERLFSVAGDIVEDKRARLLDENIQAIYLLHIFTELIFTSKRNFELIFKLLVQLNLFFFTEYTARDDT